MSGRGGTHVHATREAGETAWQARDEAAPPLDAAAPQSGTGSAGYADGAHAAGSLHAGATPHARETTRDAADASGAITPSRPAALGAFATLAALVLFCVAWEWRLAPLRPGGSALVLKALPLIVALPGVLRCRIYTLQWASMLVLLYFAEGIVRGMTDPAPGNRLGWIETALALGFFACALACVAPFKRAARRRNRETA